MRDVNGMVCPHAIIRPCWCLRGEHSSITSQDRDHVRYYLNILSPCDCSVSNLIGEAWVSVSSVKLMFRVCPVEYYIIFTRHCYEQCNTWWDCHISVVYLHVRVWYRLYLRITLCHQMNTQLQCLPSPYSEWIVAKQQGIITYLEYEQC